MPRIGLSLPNRAVLFGVSPQTLLESAETADASGLFDSVWVGDNFLSKPRLEAIVTLSAIAARTKRVRLGVVCLASFIMRSPLLLALQWGSLDVLSGGRTVLAVCLGGKSTWSPQYAAELAASGVKDDERIGRLVEGIAALRALWGPEEVTNLSGRYVQLENVRFAPKPAQERIPIVIATNPRGDAAIEEKALRRVARIADGWQVDVAAPHVFRERWTRIRAFAAEYGREREVTESSVHLMVNINDDERRAREESVEFLNHYYGAGLLGPERLETWLAVGSPATVIARIQSYLDAGCTTPILRFVSPDQAGQLRRCIDEVLPALAKKAAA